MRQCGKETIGLVRLPKVSASQNLLQDLLSLSGLLIHPPTLFHARRKGIAFLSSSDLAEVANPFSISSRWDTYPSHPDDS